MSRQLELKWTEETHSAKDIAHLYKHYLPVIIIADEGYQGITEDECIDKDQKYIITDVITQGRIAIRNTLAESNTGTIFSVPLDLDIKFHVRRNDGNYNKNKAETLADIHADRGLSEGMVLLPNVDTPVTFKTGVVNDEEQDMELGVLTVVNVFEEEYLVCFPLPELKEPYESTSIFPVHMDLDWKVARSLDGGTKDDFKRFMDIIKHNMKGFEHSQLKNGSKEIMLYSDDMGEEDPYEYATPCDYVRFSAVVLEQRSLPPMDQNELYIAGQQPPTLPPMDPNDLYLLVQQPPPRPRITRRKTTIRKPPIDEPEYSDEHAYPMVTDVFPTAKPKPQMRLTPLALHATAEANSISTQQPLDDASDDYEHPDECFPISPKSEVKTPPATKPKPVKISVNSLNDTLRADSSATTPAVTHTESSAGNSSNVAPIKTPPVTKPTPRLITVTDMNMVSGNVDTEDAFKSPTATKPATRPKSFKTIPTLKIRNTDQRNQAAIPTNAVKPMSFSQDSTDRPTAPNAVSDLTDEKLEYSSFSEIPKDVSTFSVEQIAASMHVMNMDKYVHQFRDESVDGELLLALDDEELKEFGMTSLEIKKIQMFAHKQWRPNNKQ